MKGLESTKDVLTIEIRLVKDILREGHFHLMYTQPTALYTQSIHNNTFKLGFSCCCVLVPFQQSIHSKGYSRSELCPYNNYKSHDT